MRPGGCSSRTIDSAVMVLPQPDSPTMPSVSTGRNREADVLHGGQQPAAGVEPGGELFDPKERIGRDHQTADGAANAVHCSLLRSAVPRHGIRTGFLCRYL